ncbi:hypothetical protein AB0J83_08415 [Actinoplanes sp. NPDC049596]|uniref:hypothetical protein n=1 Tax=unclassified Actinoplanes TaxID=2626549 RepID=UPI00341B9CAE
MALFALVSTLLKQQPRTKARPLRTGAPFPPIQEVRIPAGTKVHPGPVADPTATHRIVIGSPVV